MAKTLHILLVADGRSPITRSWVRALLRLGHSVSLVSTYPCEAVEDVSRMEVLPAAFGGMAGSQAGGGQAGAALPGLRRLVGRLRSRLLRGRYWLGPLTLPFHQRQLKLLVERIRPDLVHALRIPFEGMLAAGLPKGVPLAVSIWGNDLTLHAGGSPLMRRWTRRTLQRADGLAADARRDLRLVADWGFAAGKPALLAPGSGGLDLDALRNPAADAGSVLPPEAPAGAALVVNPRGFRPGSVHNDVFFQAIPQVLESRPGVHFICPAMAGQAEALGWVERLGIGGNVHLLPTLPQPKLWALFRQAQVYVSVSSHDGTPNSLLEAMACGCFPVAGEIESLREWITPGENGLLVNPHRPQEVAAAILAALADPALRTRAAAANARLVEDRAGMEQVGAQVDAFYRQILAVKDGAHE